MKNALNVIVVHVVIVVALLTYSYQIYQFRSMSQDYDDADTNDFLPENNYGNKSLVDATTPTLTCDQMQKYILLTEQRSGSSWTCDLLKDQEGISCGVQDPMAWRSEMMIGYSGLLRDENINITWSNWTSDMDEQFARLCDEQPAHAIGFKLMLDQIPEQYKFDGHFEKYLTDNNIAVVQLVREASVLRYSSVYAAVQELEMGVEIAHAYTAEELSIIPRNVTKMQWGDGQINMVVEYKNSNMKWQRALRFMPHVRHYYLSYEYLLTKKGLEDQLSHIILFLMPFPTHDVKVNIEESSLRLHSRSCSSRIQDYDDFVQRLEEAGAMNTAAACRMLESLFPSE